MPTRTSGKAGLAAASRSRFAIAARSPSRKSATAARKLALARKWADRIMHRLIAARDLVLALRAGLNRLQTMIDRPFDRLVIAELEMEERHVLGAAPIASVERVRTDEIECAGDRPPVAARQKQQQSVAHALADQVEEAARQVGLPPLPAAGVLVEGPHRVPFAAADLGARAARGIRGPRARRRAPCGSPCACGSISAPRNSSKSA